MPASSSARCNIAPAGPTKGFPSRSSLSPGCSPTSIIVARFAPAPNTTCVARAYRSQPWHRSAAAAARSGSANRERTGARTVPVPSGGGRDGPLRCEWTSRRGNRSATTCRADRTGAVEADAASAYSSQVQSKSRQGSLREPDASSRPFSAGRIRPGLKSPALFVEPRTSVCGVGTQVPGPDIPATSRRSRWQPALECRRARPHQHDVVAVRGNLAAHARRTDCAARGWR